MALIDNHARAPVPAAEAVGALSIATVLVGVWITLPAFLVGAEVVSSLGAARAALALAGSGLVLLVFGYLTIRVGAETRQSTYSIIAHTFGAKGAVAVNILLTCSLFGWFGITAMLFGQAVAKTLAAALGWFAGERVLAAIGAGLMIATTIFGFRAIERLSRITVPLLVAVMVAGVWLTASRQVGGAWWATPPAAGAAIGGIGAAMSLVIGGFMVGVTLAPDLARFMRPGASSLTAAVLGFGIGSPLVLLLAGLPAAATGSGDLIANMLAVGLGMPALLVVIFATLTTNVSNLYSASLGLARIFPGARDWLLTLSAGIAGAGLGLAGILDHFVDFLLLLSVAIPPVAGVYVSHHFLVAPRRPAAGGCSICAFLAWAGGAGTGYLSDRQIISVTQVSAIDAFVAAAILYMVFNTAFNAVLRR